MTRILPPFVFGVLVALAVMLLACSCSLVTKTYDIDIYQYGALDNSVSAEVLKEQTIEPSVRLQ
jgi:hypothetical protein